MSNEIELRQARKEDRDSIYKVHEGAFGRANEAKLVETLLKDEADIKEISLVAVTAGNVVGHILYTEVQILDDKGKNLSSMVRGKGAIAYAVALAPLAVLPSAQKRGVGKALANESLRLANERGHGIIIVLGHPEYYPKFGFEPASRFGMSSPFDVADDVFMAKPLSAFNEKICGNVIYHEAFIEVD
jgi:putative acetyltransferase